MPAAWDCGMPSGNNASPVAAALPSDESELHLTKGETEAQFSPRRCPSRVLNGRRPHAEVLGAPGPRRARGCRARFDATRVFGRRPSSTAGQRHWPLAQVALWDFRAGDEVQLGELAHLVDADTEIGTGTHEAVCVRRREAVLGYQPVHQVDR